MSASTIKPLPLHITSFPRVGQTVRVGEKPGTLGTIIECESPGEQLIVAVSGLHLRARWDGKSCYKIIGIWRDPFKHQVLYCP